MSYRQARALQDRVQLDQVVQIRRYTEINPITGTYGGTPVTAEVWCLRLEGRSELDIATDATTLVTPSAIVIRHHPDYHSIQNQRIAIVYPESPGEERRVTSVELVGRTRFLRLEVEA